MVDMRMNFVTYEAELGTNEHVWVEKKQIEVEVPDLFYDATTCAVPGINSIFGNVFCDQVQFSYVEFTGEIDFISTGG